MKEPYIILIGGATGVGTSAIASKLSEEYPVRGFQRTDSIRQVIRAVLGPLVVPEVFQSTYRAFENIDAIYDDPKFLNFGKVLYGHVRQCEKVLLGVDGAIARDIEEKINSIYEGIHILPGKLGDKDWYNKSIRIKTDKALKSFGFNLLNFEDYKNHIIELLIDIKDLKVHRERIEKRGEDYAPHRPAKKYLDNFEKIRKIRDYIVELALIKEIPIIQNIDCNKALEQCIEHITKVTNGKFVPKNNSNF